MTGLDLALEQERSSSLEPCLKLIIGRPSSITPKDGDPNPKNAIQDKISLYKVLREPEKGDASAVEGITLLPAKSTGTFI